jgi:hypothetical protein
MTRSNVHTAFVLALALVLSDGCVAAEKEWKSLFNGRDLSGWQHVGPGSFVVENGMLKTVGGMGLLWYTEAKFGDAIIRVSYQMSHPHDDSGVFIRIPGKPSEPWMPINRGYEVEIGNWPDDYSCSGVLYSLTKALARPEKPVGAWNTMEVTLEGPRTIVRLNGVTVTDYREGDSVPPQAHDYEPKRGRRPLRGYIGLQNHAEDSVVFFREVSWAPLAK